MCGKQDIVTIDGPSGAGKGTVARKVARRLGYSYLDTGAMYRALALAVLRSGIDFNDSEQLNGLLQSTDIDCRNDKDSNPVVSLNGTELSSELRTSEVSSLSSLIATNRSVRSFLVRKQKEIAEKGNIVVEGRDMGTYVFPDAKYKFYLDASLDERARRRSEQLAGQGIDIEPEAVKRDLRSRDTQDMERDESPLHPSPNAVIIDTTELAISEVVDLIVNEVTKRQKA